MLDEIQAWIDQLPGRVTIQHLASGHVYMALSLGSIHVTSTRPTFKEAAEDVIARVKATRKIVD